MPPNNPLATLTRLRDLETQRARRALADRLSQQQAAQAKVAATTDALRAERDAAPADYAAWLPRALAQAERAARSSTLATQATDAARATLAAARTAERTLERLLETRANDARRIALRREAFRLDAIPANHLAAKR